MHVVHEVVKNHLANCRQGTQSALTRAEVSGGGKKPWRQKGTGHARQGSTRAFEYQGTTFATQKVKSGEKASEPLLVPAQSGAWDFDFGTEIKANTTVKWK